MSKKRLNKPWVTQIVFLQVTHQNAVINAISHIYPTFYLWLYLPIKVTNRVSDGFLWNITLWITICKLFERVYACFVFPAQNVNPMMGGSSVAQGRGGPQSQVPPQPNLRNQVPPPILPSQVMHTKHYYFFYLSCNYLDIHFTMLNSF